PVLARGGGTGLSGQSVNTAVVFDFSKYMNQILDLDPQERTARVQPGVICDQLRDAATEHGLTFAPDPATHDHNTLGGMIGNNSCGTHSVSGGKTVDNVLELDVVLYDGTRLRLGLDEEGRLDEIIAGGGRRGEIYARLRDLRDRYADLVRERYPDIPRRVSGYNLDDLLPEKGFNTARALVGSECTCVLVLSATVRLLPWPPSRSLVVLGYPDSPAAAEHVTEILRTEPLGLEFFESGIISNLKTKGFWSEGMDELPQGRTFVLVEHGGETQEEADATAAALARSLRSVPHAPDVEQYDEQHAADIWQIRKEAIGSTRIPQEHAGLAGWEDAAVDPSDLGGYLRDYQDLVDRYGYHTVLFGHFGQGCIHNRLDLDIKTAAGIATFHRFLSDATDLVVRYGGSLSGEHGDGQLKAEFLPRMFGPELITAFEAFADIFDPDRMMNPGKVVRPRSAVDDLRLGVDYNPSRLETHFSFAEDGFNFADATNRCFGVGNCRHLDGGTMCPSFMVTREEKDSTRGRSRLLFEMMRDAGERKHPWRDEGVKDALDLCLACKGCKGDCPTRVDMATYKAEFLSHYYAGRLRPRVAYAMGLIQRWAPVASRVPRLVNALTSSPRLAPLLKAAAGIAPQRDLPRFAERTFRAQDRGRRPANPQGPSVILWADTFSNHFQPQVATAAVRVLEDAGLNVRVPTQQLCCGRPLYDYGMLTTAKRYLHRVLDSLRADIRAGVPVVGLEPSCVAVFRDELLNLMPNDEDARRLAGQTYTLAQALQELAPGWEPPTLRGSALVQVHCHQGAVLGYGPERALLERMGLDVTVPDSGCCGLAGSFGFEKGKNYDVSIACAERVILPEVRAADADTLLVADGYSCREQIGQNTGRTPMHLAEVVQTGLDAGRT
ncbi:MAG: FAD-binding and (Fe-S)-binding domain-containing protein, partial [Nocardioidaceae bacterium]